MYLQKVIRRKICFCWRLEDQERKPQDPGPDPSPSQNVTDPQYWFRVIYAWV